VLLFRIGDFYETFEADAELISRELEIVLTSRSKIGNTKIPLAGVPTMRWMAILQNSSAGATGLRYATRWKTQRRQKGS